jgi:dihydroorotate dehydrogenase electron transfer subunit
MLQFDAEVLENRRLSADFFRMELAWDPGAGRPLPGQFMTLRAGEGSAPLLRRPFAFSGFSDASGTPRASFIYQLRGPATALLSGKRAGDAVDVLGPLGRGFPAAADFAAEGSRPLLAAGGVGLGPLLFLAASLEPSRTGSPQSGATQFAPPLVAAPPLFAAPPLVLGFRDQGAVPELDFPRGTEICTDDGSAGFHGTPTDWLSQNTKHSARLGPTQGGPRLCACGPGPMLASLARLVAERGWRGSFSAEAWMACGVGACYGCAIERADGRGFYRVCADGPVFDSREIKW